MSRHQAGMSSWAPRVLGGELEDLARSEGLKSHPEHDDYLTAAHVTRVPMVGYCDVSFYVHSPQGMSRTKIHTNGYCVY